MRVQLLEKTFNYDSKLKILVIEDLDPSWYDLMFLPRMKYIKFKYFKNELIISLADLKFQNIYTTWITNLYNSLTGKSEDDLVHALNQRVRELIEISTKEKTMSLNEAMGLYSELQHLISMFEAMGHRKALMAWHKPSPANHDFDSEQSSYEIKAIGRTGTAIKISGIDQLKANDNKPLFIKLFRLDVVKNSHEDSLGSLYSEITNRLETTQKNIFEQKCAESSFSPYLGPEHEQLKFKFNIIEECEYHVDQTNFPQLRRSDLPTGIAKVKYAIDLSVIESFKVK